MSLPDSEKNVSNPFGLHTVTPYLVVENVDELIKFLESALDATVRGELMRREDGSVRHVEIAIGDSVVMMGEPQGEHRPQTGMLYTYVDDCDARYAKAIELGATSVSEPFDFPHGDRYGGVRDASGNLWWLVTHTGRPGTYPSDSAS